MTKLHTSSNDSGTVHITFNGHYYAYSRLCLFSTVDSGNSWRSITGDMPAEAMVMAITEHHENPDLLFTGIHDGS